MSSSSLAPAQLFNLAYGTSRIDTFIEKFENEKSFKLTSGGDVVLEKSNETNIKNINLLKKLRSAIIEKNSRKIETAINEFKNKSGKFIGSKLRTREKTLLEYSLSNFAKTIEFGGQAGQTAKLRTQSSKEKIGTSYFIESTRIPVATSFKATEYGEMMLIQTINSFIPKNSVLTLKIKRNTYEIIGAAKVPGDPKADIALIGLDKKAVCFISHKLSNFSAYGGISELGDNETVKNFAQKIIKILDRKKQKTNNQSYYGVNGDSFYAEIPNGEIDIILKTVYGKDFSTSQTSGINNVDFVIEGNVNIDARGNLITTPVSNKIYDSGDTQWLKTGDTRAILFARYVSSASRGFTLKKDNKEIRIDHLRFSVAPISVIKGRLAQKIVL